MFGKKKDTKRARKSDDSFGFDLMGGFDPTNMGRDNDDNDDDLEAELHQLMMDDDPPRRPARKPRGKSIDLKITDDAGNASDEDLSVDENDPELMSELNEMMGEDGTPESEEKSEESPPSPDAAMDTVNQMETIRLLEERLELYKAAELKVKNSNETSKARRFNRGVKTLQGMLRDAKAGKSVDSADIPPPLPRSATQVSDNPAEQASDSVESSPEVADTPTENSSNAPAPEPEPEPVPSVPVDEEKLELLKKRQQEYRIAAVAWKKCGNMEEAVKLVKIAKQFDVVIAALTSGQPVDLSDMPPTPELPGITMSNDSPAVHEEAKLENETQEATEATSEAPAPVTGDGIAGALKERLEVYRRTKTSAEDEGNTSKARRYGRICKQYEDAIKFHARGKPIPVDELPVPPGFPPIVIDAPPPVASVSVAAPAEEELPSEEPADAEEAKKPTPPIRSPEKPAAVTSRAEKQTVLLQRRQAELKRAALMAKKDGDLELARDYLRQAKGMDPLIQASTCGLPVDMTSIPLSPNAKALLNAGAIDATSSDSFALVSSDDCQPIDENGTDTEIYENLEAQLIKLKKVCLATRDHAKALGDVPGYNRWERMALGYSRDLDMLRVRKRDGLPSPQHHYEEKTYAIVKSCTDLTDSDLEISIIRGVNLPKEADTYVIYEFPYPSDRPPSDRTSTIKGTCNPEYDATFTLTGSVDRSARQCQRAFKRHALKCQVWSKGGFLRSDSLIGTVTVKLQPLETQCILHESFPLMNGRKTTGGKLEVKIRLRNPITTKQIEKMTDRWLIIDH